MPVRGPRIEKPRQYTLAELEAMPTISQGHTDDLKNDTGEFRIWLSRMTVADGMPYDNQVTVEKLINGVWTTIEEYKPAKNRVNI